MNSLYIIKNDDDLSIPFVTFAFYGIGLMLSLKAKNSFTFQGSTKVVLHPLPTMLIKDLNLKVEVAKPDS